MIIYCVDGNFLVRGRGWGGFGERKAQGGQHGGTAKHVPKTPPVTQARHVKPHDNISLFKVVYLSSNLKALYLQFLRLVITIYKLSINFLTPCIKYHVKSLIRYLIPEISSNQI